MTGRAIVLRGDAARLPLPDASADLIVCSPPYFGLRSYTDDGEHYAGQIGSEGTPREYLEALWRCTCDWIRVLKPCGSLFVNLGDKYAGSDANSKAHTGAFLGTSRARATGKLVHDNHRVTPGQPKSLLGLPWRYALGCMDQLGLILRAEIIWDKPNGLPESVTDRVRRSHEQVFHFTRQPRYYSAVDEVREAYADLTDIRAGTGNGSKAGIVVQPGDRRRQRNDGILGTRQPRSLLGKLPGSVWSIPSAPLTVPEHLGIDHFAAYPPELVRRIILGWSPREVCTACGEGRRPVSVAEPARTPQWALSQRQGRSWHGDGADPVRALGVAAADRSRTITGYACACHDTTAPATPGLVLDPFGGTGTTALVAAVHGRTGITIDRSADYSRLAAWRVSDPGERARARELPKPPPVPDGMEPLFDMKA